MSADDLRTTTLRWARQFWDNDAHMVWNPPASVEPGIGARQIHLTPNSVWIAYGLLGSDDAADRAEGVRSIDTLIALQYDEPGTDFHGTFARFMETPHPPDTPAMWVDYDPNWRQFVGTTFALVLEDFGDTLPPSLSDRIEKSIGLAVWGEADGRISPSYANPALMRSWLDAWFGNRTNDAALVARGESFAGAVIAAHDEHDAFDEFNSPT
ncbi:MAG TPA: hypothetical protein VNB24_10385, partial [Acidimicrobiales bacterium]|nr:hypothetical protein [Acidimicrobiales bacterium]